MKTTKLLLLSLASALATAFKDPDGTPSFMHPEPTVGIACWSAALTITYANGFFQTTLVPPPPPPPPDPTTISKPVLTVPEWPPHFDTTTQPKMAPGLGNGFNIATSSPTTTPNTPTTPPPASVTPAPAAGRRILRRHRPHAHKLLNHYTCTNEPSRLRWHTKLPMPIWLPKSGTITGSINRFITTTELSTTETGYWLSTVPLKPKAKGPGAPTSWTNIVGVNSVEGDEAFVEEEGEWDAEEVEECDCVEEAETLVFTTTSLVTVVETMTVTVTETETETRVEGSVTEEGSETTDVATE